MYTLKTLHFKPTASPIPVTKTVSPWICRCINDTQRMIVVVVVIHYEKKCVEQKEQQMDSDNERATVFHYKFKKDLNHIK